MRKKPVKTLDLFMLNAKRSQKQNTKNKKHGAFTFFKRHLFEIGFLSICSLGIAIAVGSMILMLN